MRREELPGRQSAPGGLRILALLPSAQAGRTLLRATCAHWARMGQKTVVLDGCTSESRNAPGLHQMLHGTPLPPQAGWAGSGSAWHGTSVLPARLGLKWLCAHGGTPAGLVQRLGQPSILMLHAGARPLGLAKLLPGMSLLPLLLLECHHGRQLAWPHILGTCHQIRQLAHHGAHQCLLALMDLAEPAKTPDVPAPGALLPAWPHGGVVDTGDDTDDAPIDWQALRHEASLEGQIQLLRNYARRCAVQPRGVLQLHPGRMDDIARFAQAWLEHAAAPRLPARAIQTTQTATTVS